MGDQCAGDRGIVGQPDCIRRVDQQLRIDELIREQCIIVIFEGSS